MGQLCRLHKVEQMGYTGLSNWDYRGIMEDRLTGRSDGYKRPRHLSRKYNVPLVVDPERS